MCPSTTGWHHSITQKQASRGLGLLLKQEKENKVEIKKNINIKRNKLEIEVEHKLKGYKNLFKERNR